jgi:hypothetical protein
MRGWPDVTAIADELVEITSGSRVAELHDRAQLARAAAEAEAGTKAIMPYEGVVRSAISPALDAAALHEIYVAACRAMSVAAMPPRSPEEARPSPLARLLRLVRA